MVIGGRGVCPRLGRLDRGLAPCETSSFALAMSWFAGLAFVAFALGSFATLGFFAGKEAVDEAVTGVGGAPSRL